MPESPKWLYGKKRYKECHNVLKQMAKTNDKTLNKANNLILYRDGSENEPAEKQGAVEKEVKKESICSQITEDRTILINQICMTFVWMSASFCYYLISYQLKYIQGSLWTNGIISGASEGCAYALSGILVNQLGLKKILCFAYALAILGMGCLVIF